MTKTKLTLVYFFFNKPHNIYQICLLWVQGKQGRTQGFLAIWKRLDLPYFLWEMGTGKRGCTDGEASIRGSIHAPVSNVLLNWDHHGEEGHRHRASQGCRAAAPVLGRNGCPVLPSEPGRCSCPALSARTARRARLCPPL